MSETGCLRRIIILVITLLGLAILALPLQRASLGPPQLLYEEAQEANLTTAQALYCRLSEGFPEISEYLLLASARAAMPDVEAVQELKGIIDYRPHSPAAFEAHLILARYYADLLQRTVHLRTPDNTFNNAFAWAKIGTEKGLATNPMLGTGFVAGYRTAGNSERPGFAWFFGRDAHSAHHFSRSSIDSNSSSAPTVSSSPPNMNEYMRTVEPFGSSLALPSSMALSRHPGFSGHVIRSTIIVLSFRYGSRRTKQGPGSHSTPCTYATAARWQ